MAALPQPSTPETTDVDSSKLAPERGAAGETPKVDAPKAEAPKAEAKDDAPRGDAPPSPEKVMIMSAADRVGPAPKAEQSSGMLGKRRLAALAAVGALAAGGGGRRRRGGARGGGGVT